MDEIKTVRLTDPARLRRVSVPYADLLGRVYGTEVTEADILKVTGGKTVEVQSFFESIPEGAPSVAGRVRVCLGSGGRIAAIIPG